MSYQRRASGEFTTVFGSLASYVKGEIEIINDDPRNYVFSNVFDVAAKSAPYEKVVVAKHGQYAIEVLRAEGASEWFAAGHDEFALVMDGRVEIELVKLDLPAAVVSPGAEGSMRLVSPPVGRNMGFMRLGRGHQALLPEEKVEAMRKGLAELAPGRWIHVDHPAYDAPETRAIHHVGYEGVAVDRQGVVDAWTDPEVLSIIEQRGIQLISYGDVKRGIFG